jgi:thymidylate synthase (FAD)
MRIVDPYYEIETEIDGEQILKDLEEAGRTCYKSEEKITADSAKKFVAMLIKRGHHSVLEHGCITVRFICDRGVSHEIVRHRLASYSQESTRYCNYSQDRFGSEITVIDLRPFMEDKQQEYLWEECLKVAETRYFQLLGQGAAPQIARSVLPNSLKTEIVMTCNYREWRHFFKMRADPPAHPQMRQLACPLLAEFREKIPVLFDDVGDPECALA